VVPSFHALLDGAMIRPHHVDSTMKDTAGLLELAIMPFSEEVFYLSFDRAPNHKHHR
jgi:hypothetical protein